MNAGDPDYESLKKAYRAWAKKEANKAFGVSGSVNEAAVKRAVEEKMLRFPALAAAMDVLMRSRVQRVSLLLVGQQPVPRLQLRCGSRRYTVEPYRLVESALETLMRLDANDRWRFPVGAVVHELEPWLQTRVAVVRADAANEVAAALVDEELTRPIRDKIARQREQARLRALEEVKELFRRTGPLLSKDDVTTAWDEVIVQKVMDS